MSCSFATKSSSRAAKCPIATLLLAFAALWPPIAARAAVEYSVKNLGAFTPTAMNNKGQVVGYVEPFGTPEAYFYDGTKLIDLTRTYGLSGAPLAINDQGQIAGTSPVNGVNTGGFLFSNGITTDLGNFGAEAINNEGQLAGGVSSQPGTTDAAVYSNGTATDLGTLGGTKSLAFSINDSGQVVGEVYTPTRHGFFYSDGKMTDIRTLSGNPNDVSSLLEINNLGHAVGYSFTGQQWDALIYKDGKLIDMSHMTIGHNSFDTYGRSINDSDVFVGSYGPADLSHAFVYRNGQFQTLESVIGPADVSLYAGISINNAGQILAYGSGEGSNAFLLTPVPEPSGSLCLLVIGSGLALRRRRRS